MGNIRRFADNFLQLQDTPAAFAGAADQFVRVNGTPDALVFFDLLGSANTFTAVQTLGAGATAGGDILPATNDTQDLGSDALSFQQVWSRQGVFVEQSGVGAITFNAAEGGVIGGRSVGPLGTSRLEKSGTYPPVALFGNAYSGGSATNEGTVVNAGGGSSVLGSAFASGPGTKTAQIICAATSYGSMTGGYAIAYGGAGNNTARIQNYGSGSLLWGYANSTGGGTALLRTEGYGSLCVGRAEGTGNNTLRASGNGSLAQGFVSSTTTGLIETTAAAAGAFAQGNASLGGQIRATAVGAFAQGSANGATGLIEATGIGSLARGAVTTGSLTASAAGAIALGSAGAGTIAASAANAIQLGLGSNSVADSFQVGGDGANAGFRALFSGQHGSPEDALTLGAAATTFAASSNAMVITGDAGANTIATITGGVAGQLLNLRFVDALVTITDDNTATADSVNLQAPFTSSADQVLTLSFNGTKWFEVSRASTALGSDLVYGEIFVTGGTTTQTTNATPGTFDLITGFNTAAGSDGASNGTTPASASNQITLDTAGTYEVHFSCSFSGTNSAEITCRAFLAGTGQANLTFVRKLGTGGDIGLAHFTGLLSGVTASQVLDVRVASDGGSDSFTPQEMNLTAVRIGA